MKKLTPILIAFIALIGLCSAVSAWQIETIDTISPGQNADQNLALDAAGNPHICYLSSDYDLRYAYKDSSGWHIETVDKVEGDMVGRSNSIIIDSTGNPHISYIDNINGLKYAHKDSSGWHVEEIDSFESNEDTWTTIDLDSLNNPHIAYSHYDMKYASKDPDGQWHTEYILCPDYDPLGDYNCPYMGEGRYPSLKLDSKDYPHICYNVGWSGNSADGDIIHVYKDETGWHNEYALQGGDFREKSLAIDAFDNLHVTYYDRSLQILGYMFKNSSGWYSLPNDVDPGAIPGVISGEPFVVDYNDGFPVGFFNSLALDNSGNPYTSYFLGYPYNDLKYAFLDSSGWHREVIASEGYVGVDVSIALDSSDNPHISYVSSADPMAITADLKYATLAELIAPPVANFTANITSGIAPINVQFNDTSTNSPTSWNWNFGDIGPENTSTLKNPVHTYSLPGSYTVSLNVTNSAGSNTTVKTDYVIITQANYAPVLDLIGNKTGNEGSTLVFKISATDSDGDILTYSASSLPIGSTFDPTTQIFTWNIGYSNAGTYTNVHFEVTDGKGSDSENITISVNNINQAPILRDIAAPVDPIMLGNSATISTAFSDLDIDDTHKAVCYWGDNSQLEQCTIQEASGSGTISCSHTYTSPGVYAIKLELEDNYGLNDTKEFSYIVIYDPAGGFITGGGWIMSPSGAYIPDPSSMGKATFGFVSKYEKGAKVPTGQTEFQFKTGNMNFKSTSYEWLVVAGPKAQYKGVGNINGDGAYGFMLTAIDGAINGGSGSDKFRIKIWDNATEGIVYDNKFNAPDTSDPTTELGGGSIVIHAK
jgi:PKD repeat protein